MCCTSHQSIPKQQEQKPLSTTLLPAATTASSGSSLLNCTGYFNVQTTHTRQERKNPDSLGNEMAHEMGNQIENLLPILQSSVARPGREAARSPLPEHSEHSAIRRRMKMLLTTPGKVSSCLLLPAGPATLV
ncbi:unnamed protein product [Eretmochelys imbricata]